jgi:hypothetical protein
MEYNENDLREDLVKIYSADSYQVTMFDIMLKNYNISESKLIEACKYGYDFHKTTQFPDMEFEESSALGNFKQKLLLESFYTENFYRSNLDWMKVLFDPKYDMKPLDNDDLENK